MSNTKLSLRQSRFVKEYLVDLNGGKAAIRAGYAASGADVEASRLLRNPKIKKLLADETARIEKKLELSHEWVLKRLRIIVDRCMQASACMEFDKEEKTYIQKTDPDGNLLFQFEAPAAERALEAIGKHLGMFTEKVEHSGTINTHHSFDIVIEGVKQ